LRYATHLEVAEELGHRLGRVLDEADRLSKELDVSKQLSNDRLQCMRNRDEDIRQLNAALIDKQALIASLEDSLGKRDEELEEWKRVADNRLLEIEKHNKVIAQKNAAYIRAEEENRELRETIVDDAQEKISQEAPGTLARLADLEERVKQLDGILTRMDFIEERIK